MPQSPRASLSVLSLVCGGLLLLAGCGGGGGGDGVQIQAGDRSPAIDGATARVTAPADSAVVDDDSAAITIEAENFEAGIQTDTERADEIANSGNGQHFHVILDNQPYMANYEAGTLFDLGDLEPGAHTLIAFPSRSYHESVKGGEAYDLVNFYVGEESGEFMLGAREPAIIYSRPKGTYSGDGADRIMLDFYLHNVELGPDGYQARYTIRDAEGGEVASTTLTEWAPAFVTGLEGGTYEVTLQLIGSDGNVVPGPLNDTTREIEVRPGN
ncbi:hypothetical protein [Salinibacter altiplanensis]|uniref:hypothetical protein n=1 Tax=Salinibacter altiplanensis TaxID=1803181 RepID=UPI001F186DE7|nr:hypothetical protein [Salinibacter altiplanensis]